MRVSLIVPLRYRLQRLGIAADVYYRNSTAKAAKKTGILMGLLFVLTASFGVLLPCKFTLSRRPLALAAFAFSAFLAIARQLLRVYNLVDQEPAAPKRAEFLPT